MKRSALLGGTLWIGLAAGSVSNRLPFSTIEVLFLLAPMVVVRLGLKLFTQLESEAANSNSIRVVRWLQFPAAILVICSFFLERGIGAAALVLPWLFLGCLVGCRGMLLLFSRPSKNLKTACVIVSFFYLPIGCTWLIASRYGLSPIGIQEPIVLLTAVHFHFAGFGAPLMTRAVADTPLRSRFLARKMFSVVATGVLAGPGVLAAGFVVGPRLKLAAALPLAASEIGLAIFFLVAVRNLRPRWARAFVAISAASLIGAMCLAGVWAIGEFPLQPFVHLPEMAKFHGTANALGFTVCGLLGWAFSKHDMTDHDGGT